MKTTQTNPQNVDGWHEAAEEEEMVDLTQKPVGGFTASKLWIKNALYILHESDREIIESPTGWLNDKIIDASQKLLAQHFPHTRGLKPPYT